MTRPRRPFAITACTLAASAASRVGLTGADLEVRNFVSASPGSFDICAKSSGASPSTTLMRLCRGKVELISRTTSKKGFINGRSGNAPAHGSVLPGPFALVARDVVAIYNVAVHHVLKQGVSELDNDIV